MKCEKNMGNGGRKLACSLQGMWELLLKLGNTKRFSLVEEEPEILKGKIPPELIESLKERASPGGVGADRLGHSSGSGSSGLALRGEKKRGLT